MSDHPIDDNVRSATRTLMLLNAQAHALRREVRQLQQELADVRREFNEDHAAQLVEANEHLVIAAIEAQIAAEAATLNRDLLERSSQRDPLTDTSNRASMLDLMENAFSQSQSQGHYAAVFFLDLDNFKTINDTLGHGTGDMVLQLVAQRLKSSVRDSDAVSRHGGDEFVVLLANITAPIDIVTIAQKMLRDIAAQTRIGGHLLNLSASLGIAVCPNDGTDAETLISLADAAMYCAKRLGGGLTFHADQVAQNTVALATASCPPPVH
jgi:diguanylate cyclase (GGDEF)-like protein